MEKKPCLILDKDFIKYCELNEIEDMEKFAKEVFKKGFDLEKYGDEPRMPATIDELKGNRMVAKEIIPVDPPLSPPPDMPTPKEDVREKKPKNKDKILNPSKKPVKSSEKDLYDE